MTKEKNKGEADTSLPQTEVEWLKEISKQLGFITFLLFLIMMGTFLGIGT